MLKPKRDHIIQNPNITFIHHLSLTLLEPELDEHGVANGELLTHRPRRRRACLHAANRRPSERFVYHVVL